MGEGKKENAIRDEPWSPGVRYYVPDLLKKKKKTNVIITMVTIEKTELFRCTEKRLQAQVSS